MVKKILNIFFLFFIPISIFAQSSNDIKNKNAELGNIKNEIKTLEKELKSLSEKEKESLSALSNIGEQKLLLNKVISNLDKKEKTKERSLNHINNEINKLDKSINQLKEEYSRYIVWLYKNNNGNKLKHLVLAESLNQALVRYKYLSIITDQNEKKIEELNEKIEAQKKLKSKYKNEINNLRKITEEKNSEQKKLDNRKNENEKLVSTLRQNTSLIEKEIDEKRKAEVLIKSLISKLIEAERARQRKLREERLKNANNKNIEPPKFDYDSFENFAQLHGKMNWPTNSSRVIRKFGENKHKELQTVTVNYGIDIQTEKNSKVVCVAEGIVSAIQWIAGYGSVVIITHKNNYRTVYGHLENINFEEGDKVLGGDVIGQVNESLEGNILHFEIWNERNYQNPENWLVRK